MCAQRNVIERSGEQCVPVSLGSMEETALALHRAGKQTHRQHPLLTLLCHTRPPSFHCLLLEKGHKPFRVEGVIQLVQGALLSCLSWLGHVVEIQLQGACGRAMPLEDVAITVHLRPLWVGRLKSSLLPLQFVLTAQPRG